MLPLVHFIYGRNRILLLNGSGNERKTETSRSTLASAAGIGVANRLTWIGATTFDVGVGVSHRTGQITHHIAQISITNGILDV